MTPAILRELVATARFGRKQVARSERAMAITSHPVATRVALDALRAGGTACDAALAAAAAQTVVEPHMTTITGVLSLLHRDAASGETSYLNGSVARPVELPGFSAADVESARAVAVPGWWAGFDAAAERFGTLPRRALLEPAIGLAREGFPMYPYLFGTVFERQHRIGVCEQGREIFFPDGALVQPGETVRQTRAAATLEAFAELGADHLYRGSFGRELVAAVRAAGGSLTTEDLDAYEVRWQAPAAGRYRDVDLVVSPPPDHGGTLLVEMLNLAEQLDLRSWGPPAESAETLSWLIRIHNEVYVAGARQRDPRSHPLPLDTLLSKDWARTRLQLLGMDGRTPAPPATPGSNQVTVVDAAGNVATLLHSSMCTPWSSGLFVGGVSVNAAGAHYLRVMPEPGDRISSIVAPTMLLRDGEPILAAGSPSLSLLANLLQNVVNLVDFGIDVGASVHLPRFGGPGAQTLATSSDVPPAMLEVELADRFGEQLARDGVAVTVLSPWHHQCGSFEGIVRDPAGGALTACGDPRRNSVAEGL